MPPFGLLLGQLDFSSMLYVLDSRAAEIPTSLIDAKAKGIPVIAYGQFINDVIGFVIISAVVFMIVKQVNRLKRIGDHLLPDPPRPVTTRECPFCLSAIAVRAIRCRTAPRRSGVGARRTGGWGWGLGTGDWDGGWGAEAGGRRGRGYISTCKPVRRRARRVANRRWPRTACGPSG